MEHALHLGFLVLHLVGLVFGVGGATLTDLVFVNAVRKKFVSKTVIRVMDHMSQAVIAGFFLLVASGVGLLFTGTDTSPRFWAKMIVVAVVGLNGYLAHRWTFPKLAEKIHAGKRHVSLSFLQLLSINAAVSGTSWYTALFIGTWKMAWIPFAVWVGGYVVLLGLVVLIALLVTPSVLRVDDPAFDGEFPTLSNSYWPPPKL